MYQCNDVSINVSIYATLFCNDVTRYMYRDTMRYINMPYLLIFAVCGWLVINWRLMAYIIGFLLDPQSLQLFHVKIKIFNLLSYPEMKGTACQKLIFNLIIFLKIISSYKAYSGMLFFLYINFCANLFLILLYFDFFVQNIQWVVWIQGNTKKCNSS
jgi:hypothetical protein